MTLASRLSRPSAFAVFRRRNFTLLWIAQPISVAGSALTALAASILVYRLTGSALSVGLIVGVFVDRYDRKQIMIAADLVRALLVGAIPLLVPLGIAWLYGIVIVSSAVGVLQSRPRQPAARDRL